jgi:cell division septal protein FtsQ
MSLWARLRMFWIFIVAGLVLAAAAGYALVSRPEFRLRSLTVTGNHVVDRRDVVAAAAIPFDANVWTLDTRVIARRIEAIPFVATARVHRRLPANVELAITERTPLACVTNGGSPVTIDGDRRVLATTCLSGDLLRYDLRLESPPSPGQFLEDEDVGRVQRDAAIFTAAGFALRTVGFDRFGSLDAVTATGLRLRCGDDADLEKKVRLIGPILDATKKRLQTVETIDLRAPSTPVVQYR